MVIRNSSLNKVAIALLLGIAGFLGNWFKLQLFFNVDFLFGSFFVMLTAARYGVVAALIAGVIAGSCSFLLWNHPWAVIIFTAEALFVSLLNRRQPGRLVILDTVYWLCVGMPLVWLFYYLVMGMDAEATLLVALKQSINGIFNALLATICIYCAQLFLPANGSKDRFIPLRKLIFTAMVTVSIVPCFIYLVHDIRGDVLNMEKDICRRVDSIAESSRDILRVWTTSNLQSAVALAQLVGDPNTALLDAMQPYTEALHLANPALLRLVVTDSRARSVSFSPLADSTGKSTLGIDYSDRSFIFQLRQLKKPLISDVELARVGPPVPRLAFVAPVLTDGTYRGYCAGIVSLNTLAEKLKILVRNRSTDVTVLDRTGRVVASSSERWQPMQRFSRPAASEERWLKDGVYHWIPAPGKNTSFMRRWKDSLFVKETKFSEETPWTIIAEGSPAPYLDQLNRKTIDDLLLLWGVILLSLAVSHVLSNGFVLTLQRLETISTQLPQTIATNMSLSWPESRIVELSNLVGNFRLMTTALADHFHKLQGLNEELEIRVEERTGELRESEERYRTIVSTANEGIWLVNKNFAITMVNQQLTGLLGYRPEEMIGRPLAQFICENELSDHGIRMRNRIQGLSEQYERHMRKRDGTEVCFLLSATPVIDGEKRFQGSFAMCTDITERKRMEKALQDANTLLQKTFTSLNEAIFLVQTGSRTILDCNATVEKMFGYTRDEIIGVNTSCLHISEEMSQRFGSEMLQAYEAKGHYETIFRMKRKDGTVFDSEHFVSPITDDTGAIVSHVCVVRDISDRKHAEEALLESEERFRSLFEGHSAVMLLIDPADGAILNANAAAATFYGYSRDGLCQMHIEQINCLPPDLVAAARRRFLSKEINRVFFPHRLSSGEIRTVETHSAPIQLRGQTVLFSIIHDVTEQMRAEKALHRLNVELEQRVSTRTADLERLNKELESFCYSISHEMRAPIARLEGFSRMMIESDPLSDPDTQAHCAKRIEVASQQLRAVIDSLLMMNRLSRAEMTLAPVNLSRMARQIVDELQEEVGMPTLNVTIAPDIVANGDRYLLEICLRNLLGNAVKFTAKAPDAVIEFGQMQQSGTNVYYVRDNGAGFDMTFASMLFKPFSRLHTHDEFKGSGIGLATVQRIIERHGGQIWAEASPGKGATFYFTLGNL